MFVYCETIHSVAILTDSCYCTLVIIMSTTLPQYNLIAII